MNWYDMINSLDWEGIAMTICVVLIPLAYIAGEKIGEGKGYKNAQHDRRVADRKAKRAYRLAARTRQY